MKRICAAALACAVMFAVMRESRAEDVSEQLRAMQAQLDRINQVVEKQQQTIAAQQQQLEEQNKKLVAALQPTATVNVNDPLAGVLGRIERAEAQSETAIKLATRKKPNELNMSIGAAVDTSFRFTDAKPADTDRASGNDFAVRGAEAVFYADVDPNFKTYMVLNSAPDPLNNDEAVPSLEEAAIFTTSLQNVQVKGGRFFMPFGRLSMIHDHDLPFTTRPPSLDNYVGGESAGDGVMAQALLPLERFVQVTGGIFNKMGADSPLGDTVGDRRSGSELTFFGKILTSFDIGDAHTFETGVSAAEVPDKEKHRNLTNFEFTYKWHPSGTNLRQKLVWGTELMRNNLRSRFLTNPGDDPPVFARDNKTGYGGYSYVEYFLDPHWSMGPRVDLFQNVDPAVVVNRNMEQTYTAFVSYNFSEFCRLRLEVDRHEYFDGTRANEVYLQWTAFFGAHVHGFEGR